jgi:hypothetical protein
MKMNDQPGTDPQTPPGPPRDRYRRAATAASEPVEFEAPVQPILVRPVAHIRSPILAKPTQMEARARVDDVEPVPIAELIRDYWPIVSPVVVIGGAFLLFTNDQWAMFAAATTAVGIGMRAVARRITFTFADGFLAFRKDESWPRGVQEEYDVPYAWPSTGRFAPDGAPKAA